MNEDDYTQTLKTLGQLVRDNKGRSIDIDGLTVKYVDYGGFHTVYTQIPDGGDVYEATVKSDRFGKNEKASIAYAIRRKMKELSDSEEESLEDINE